MREAIAQNYETIRPYVRRTPIIEVQAGDFGRPNAALTLKLEYLQHTGSFKARGAITNLLTRRVPAAGVVAASGGNHGVAVAWAAHTTGHPARIFVPEVASPAKLQRIRDFGAQLTVTGQRYNDALLASETWRAESGAMPVHAYEQHETLLGQGSVGLELEEQAPQIDSLLVACGGGGLIGGIAAWYEGRVKIVAVEPTGAPTLYKALEAGRPVECEAGSIAADSLAPKSVGNLMFPIAQRYIGRVVLVEDDDIREAQRALWNTLRIVAEPGGAAAFGAWLSGKYTPAPNERTAILICGANTTAVNFQL